MYTFIVTYLMNTIIRVPRLPTKVGGPNGIYRTPNTVPPLNSIRPMHCNGSRKKTLGSLYEIFKLLCFYLSAARNNVWRICLIHNYSRFPIGWTKNLITLTYRRHEFLTFMLIQYWQCIFVYFYIIILKLTSYSCYGF